MEAAPAAAVLVVLHVALTMALAGHGVAYAVMAGRRLRMPPPWDPAPPPAGAPQGLPRVCVQVAVRNEGALVAACLHAVQRLDWPAGHLEVQVLDDSDDGSGPANAAIVLELRDAGLDIRHVQRGTRAGFKAGALQHGLGLTSCEVIAPLDVDFLPPPDLLRRLVPHLADPSVGCVQARWSSRNEHDNLLTRAQDLAMDGHFVVEQRVRAAAGTLMSFNATACAWRRQAITAVGGWPTATLTEDLDLSTRALLAGWRFVYLEATSVPALLPPGRRAFATQQARWARGSLHAARLHTGAVLRRKESLRWRLATLHHLWHYSIHPLILGLVLVQAALVPVGLPMWYLAASLILMGGGPVSMYAVATLKLHGWRGLPRLGRLVPLAIVGLGITPRLAAAGAAGLLSGRTGDFVRTRKNAGRSGVDGVALACGLAAAGWLAAAGSISPLSGALAAFAAACLLTAFWP